jgi:transposase
MTQDLSQIIATTTNGRLRIRLLAVSHFKAGKNRPQIASFLKVSRTSANKWSKSYLGNGLTGLQEKAHTGRPKALTDL